MGYFAGKDEDYQDFLRCATRILEIPFDDIFSVNISLAKLDDISSPEPYVPDLKAYIKNKVREFNQRDTIRPSCFDNSRSKEFGVFIRYSRYSCFISISSV